MQIPQNIVNMLSAKGKGYVEAAMKIAEGQRLMNEGTLEMAHLDGKKLSVAKRMNAGGADVLQTVSGLAKPKTTPEHLKALLANGPLSLRDLATAAGCSLNCARGHIYKARGVRRVGSGNQVKWALGTAAPKKPVTVANKVLRRAKAKPMSPKAERQAKAKAANPAQQKADEDKIVAALTAKPNLGMDALMAKLGRSFYPVQRALKSLIAAGRIKPITYTHEKTGRVLPSWAPTGHGA